MFFIFTFFALLFSQGTSDLDSCFHRLGANYYHQSLLGRQPVKHAVPFILYSKYRPELSYDRDISYYIVKDDNTKQKNLYLELFLSETVSVQLVLHYSFDNAGKLSLLYLLPISVDGLTRLELSLLNTNKDLYHLNLFYKYDEDVEKLSFMLDTKNGRFLYNDEIFDMNFISYYSVNNFGNQ